MALRPAGPLTPSRAAAGVARARPRQAGCRSADTSTTRPRAAPAGRPARASIRALPDTAPAGRRSRGWSGPSRSWPGSRPWPHSPGRGPRRAWRDRAGASRAWRDHAARTKREQRWAELVAQPVGCPIVCAGRLAAMQGDGRRRTHGRLGCPRQVTPEIRQDHACARPQAERSVCRQASVEPDRLGAASCPVDCRQAGDYVACSVTGFCPPAPGGGQAPAVCTSRCGRGHLWHP